jgi:hypothetical protein
MSYLKGYTEGLEIDKTSKEWKVIDKMMGLMDEMVAYIEDLQSQVDELSELCENLDEDLGDVETEVFSCDCDELDDLDDYDEPLDSDDDFDDDQLYEAICPTCGRTILLTEDMLDEGGIECSCGESLEFDFENIEEGEDIPIYEILDEELLEDLSELNSLDE